MRQQRSELPPSRRQYIKPPMPAFVPIHEPRLVDRPPTGNQWLHEIKHDGYRVQAHVRHGEVTIYTRRGNLWRDKFTPLVEIEADLARLPDCILDGELCALGPEGFSDFFALRRALSPGKTGGLVVFWFDLLWHEQEDLRPYALMTRKSVLEELLGDALSERLRFVGELPQGGQAMLDAACRMGLEGIVSKDRGSVYRAGKADTWRKAKCRPDQEFVIGGWRQKPNSHIEAVAVGVHDDEGNLVFVGEIDRGLAVEPELGQKLKAILADTSPFDQGGPRGHRTELHWVRPELVATVAFNQWTDAGRLRQSSFKGLREGIDPRTVRREARRP